MAAPPVISTLTSSIAPATSVVTAPVQLPSTQIITSIVTPTATSLGETPTPQTVVVTRTSTTSSISLDTSASISTPSSQTSQIQSNQPTAPATVGQSISKGAIAGIAIGALLGILLIAAAAFMFGWRMRRRQHYTGSEHDTGAFGGYKAELDGRGLMRRWASKATGRGHVAELDSEIPPQELPAHEVARARQTAMTEVGPQEMDALDLSPRGR